MKRIIYIMAVLVLIVIQNNSVASASGRQSLINLVSIGQEHAGQTDQKILIVSTRNFISHGSLVLEKGVHPENKRFFFVVGTCCDSTVVTHYPSLKVAMSHLDKDKNMLVYVNGYKKTFEGTIKGGKKLSSRYNINAIMFDWPTDERPIRITAKNARKVSHNLAISLNEIGQVQQDVFPGSKLSVVFHSMGNHVARHLVKGGSIELLDEDVVDNVILNAAAVKSYDHNRWVERLRHKEKVYVVMNKFDYVLRGASLLRGVRQLGNVSLGEKASNAYYIDFSDIAEKEHSYYLGLTEAEKKNPSIFDFYNAVFQGIRFSDGREGILVASQ